MRNFQLWLLISLLGYTNFSSAQDKNTQIWEKLLTNERKNALEEFQSLEQSINIEYILLEKIIQSENGKFQFNPDFIERLQSFPEYEYYLYALWNKDFIFSNYLESGFNATTIRTIEKLNIDRIENPMIKNAAIYLKSVIARYNNDWKQYYALQNEILAIKEWQYCGVFENLNKSGLDISYAPENESVSSSGFDTNGHGIVNWYTPQYNNREAYQFFTNHDEYGYGVNYAQTFIDTPSDQKAILRLGNSGNVKVWLNDVPIFENTADVSTELDAYRVEMILPAGTNRLLIKNAESNSVSYFMARLTDPKGDALKEVTYSSLPKNYNKGNLAKIQPKILKNEIELYFENKVKEHPSNFFYTFCLANTYLRNSKYKEIKKLILPIQKAYPKSSLVRVLLIKAYQLEEDFTRSREIQKNMELDDESYILSLMLKFQDQKKLSRMDIASLEAFYGQLSEATDLFFVKQSADLMLALRKDDRSRTKSELNKIIQQSKKEKWIRILTTYSGFYTSFFKEKEKEEEIIKYVNKNYFDYGSITKLATIYTKQNEPAKALELLEKLSEEMPGDNGSLVTVIRHLHKYDKYKESLSYIDKALQNYPYSYLLLKLKGDALLQLKRKMEALALYTSSLQHNSNNQYLRKKIRDLTGEKDVFEAYEISDPYQYIANNRGAIKENNYGYNVLLDESINLLYPESGGKTKNTYIYEITSESGIENFKEYNLGLSGSYSIIKSEIVKKDGAIVPADRSGSNFVFNGLSIGDVIYINYESNFSGSGRFYKDFIDYYQFDSFSPCLRSKYVLITPKEKEVSYTITNGEVPVAITTNEHHKIYTWKLENYETLAQDEYYMPNAVDVSRYLHISTIPSWNDIAIWYSDLVRTQMESNQEVDIVFDAIFPKGVNSLSKTDIAKKIYYYIMDTMSYSHVSFRQSGFIPQKPSKTITTKLGDCKDFSTLFATLARKAGLDSNLVLVLTSDNGKRALVLPSQNFNHCIAKVSLEDGDQYLELTNKHLPFGALPVSLEDATILEIPYSIVENNNNTQQLESLQNPKRNISVYHNDVVINIEKEVQKYKVKTAMEGALTSYYRGVFEEPSYDKIKKSISENFSSNLGSQIKIDSIYDITKAVNLPVLSFTTDITTERKIDKIGKTHIFKLPKVSSAYEHSIIDEDIRKYPIEYIQYESIDQYETTYHLYIGEEETFTEIPENKKFTFQNHRYEISYKRIKPNHLEVHIEANVQKNIIAPEDYSTFKKFVADIIEAKDAFIGFQ